MRDPFFPGVALPILAQTPRLMIVNKPPGLAAHPGPSTRDSVEERLLPQARGGPWLAHRLDADTAGCLAIARRKAALIEIQAAFRERRVRKLYWAVVAGEPERDSGEIEAPLGRVSSREGWRMEVRKDGDAAVTRWRVLGRGNGLAWLELELLTGRTHQARAHCAWAGMAILGDRIYGKDASRGLHLLARSLHLPLADGPVEATAEPPPAMIPALTALGWSLNP